MAHSSTSSHAHRAYLAVFPLCSSHWRVTRYTIWCTPNEINGIAPPCANMMGRHLADCLNGAAMDPHGGKRHLCHVFSECRVGDPLEEAGCLLCGAELVEEGLEAELEGSQEVEHGVMILGGWSSGRKDVERSEMRTWSRNLRKNHRVGRSVIWKSSMMGPLREGDHHPSLYAWRLGYEDGMRSVTLSTRPRGNPPRWRRERWSPPHS